MNAKQLEINKNSSANNATKESKTGEGSKRKASHLFKSREISMEKYKILMKPQNAQQADLDASPYSEMSPQPNHFAFNQNEILNNESKESSP
jgi:hypothetical protein